MRNILSRLFLLALLFSGCRPPRIITVLKPGYQVPSHYNEIMVVGILKEENDSLRAALEKQMADKLNASGNNTISALQVFGHNGFQSLGEKGTYLKLCESGIDAVLTIALIDESNKAYQKNELNEKYTAAYYYERIWNYKKIQDEVQVDRGAGNHRYVWEVILFDLSSLKPQCVFQSRSFSIANTKKEAADLPKWLIPGLFKENVIKKRSIGSFSPKPF